MTNRMTDVSRYLGALNFDRSLAEEGWAWGAGPFVTISRQAGAGGHALADALIAELGRRSGPGLGRGWRRFDQALIELVSKDRGLEESLRSLLSEEYFSGGHDALRQMFMRALPQDVALGRVFRCLRGLAGVGKVVILGRGGVCLTGNLPGGIHVRLVASRETRLARMQEIWKLPAAAAERRLDDLEKSRAAMIRDRFGREIEDPLLYDAVFNADRLGFPEIARWIADRVAAKAEALKLSTARA
jgi:hypothetical protein